MKICKKSVKIIGKETTMNLKSLLDKITEKNIHKEVDSGPSRGEESW
jgi:antitoxin component of MazEF toxin-antitoxin module